MDEDFHQAVKLLESLRTGDRVRVTLDESPPAVHDVTVSREAWRDSSYESIRVAVTYGPGRYSFDLTASAMTPQRRGLVLPGNGQTVQVLSRADPAIPDAVKALVNRNRDGGWKLDYLDGRTVARKYVASYRDYPEPWYGYLWPNEISDPGGIWIYEVRAIRARKALVPEVDPVVLDRGIGSLREVFSYLSGKR